MGQLEEFLEALQPPHMANAGNDQHILNSWRLK